MGAANMVDANNNHFGRNGYEVGYDGVKADVNGQPYHDGRESHQQTWCGSNRGSYRSSRNNWHVEEYGNNSNTHGNTHGNSSNYYNASSRPQTRSTKRHKYNSYATEEGTISA